MTTGTLGRERNGCERVSDFCAAVFGGRWGLCVPAAEPFFLSRWPRRLCVLRLLTHVTCVLAGSAHRHVALQDALESAMKNGLWGHALLLASKMDNRTHARVMTR